VKTNLMTDQTVFERHGDWKIHHEYT
jgi:hypothetical protein